MECDGCPDPSVLRQYLDDSFDPQPGDPIAAHFAACPRCRALLEDPTEHADQVRWRELWGLRNPLSSSESNDPRDEDGPLDSEPRLPASIQVEGFEVLGVMGRGGSGVVYKARQVKLDRLVALKMLTAGAHASRRAIKRFREESMTIARLRHPQVVALYDLGEHQGVPYLCLELVEGGSLAQRLGGQPVPPPEAARITSALARVVQEAHDRGIIHRDLKPANVLVAGPRDEPLDPARLKLTDFGLARRLDQDSPAHASLSGMVLGTPSYMAPEQARNRAMTVGPAIDVYGLGAIFYELLTGRPPFRGDSPIETVFQVVGQRPDPPSHVDHRVPGSLDAICLKCLEKDPKRRYLTARDLADELDRFLSDGAKHRTERPWKSGLRAGRVITIGAAAIVLMLLAVLGLSLVDRPQKGRGATPLAHRHLELTTPANDLHVDQKHYMGVGRVAISPAVSTVRAPREVIQFDLNDDRHKSYLDGSLTRNARIWSEKRHGIRYWGPIDDRKDFEVVYKFALAFPVRSASLYASLSLDAADASGVLEVSTDRDRAWKAVIHGSTIWPYAAPVNISEWVRGARTILVRAG